MDEDFVSVKIGDVNGSAIANATMSSDDRSAGTLLFDVDRTDRSAEAGGERRLHGELQSGRKRTRLPVHDEPRRSGSGRHHAGRRYESGELRHLRRRDHDILSTVTSTRRIRSDFPRGKAGSISEMLGVSSRDHESRSIYRPRVDEKLDVAFRFNNGGVSTITGVGFELYQNQPNPFVNKTFIGFHLPRQRKRR